jgi:Restriction endonuclease
MAPILKPLSRVLRTGLPISRPIRDDDRRVLELVGRDGTRGVEISYDRLSPADWGYVYERVVGCYFEDQGYTVQQRGIELQMLDRGIDIVAELPGQIEAFIQCKSGGKRLGKQALEVILYAGGNFIHQHRRYRRSELILAVPCIKDVCSSFNLKRFLSHSNNAFGVKVSVVEVPWVTPVDLGKEN